MCVASVRRYHYYRVTVSYQCTDKRNGRQPLHFALTWPFISCEVFQVHWWDRTLISHDMLYHYECNCWRLLHTRIEHEGRIRCSNQSSLTYTSGHPPWLNLGKQIDFCIMTGHGSPVRHYRESYLSIAAVRICSNAQIVYGDELCSLTLVLCCRCVRGRHEHEPARYKNRSGLKLVQSRSSG